MSPSTPLPNLSTTPSTRVDVINVNGGRILCIADLRGGISMVNALAAEHNASAVIHSGDFGFFEPSSLPTISERTLRHLVTYSSLLTPSFRSQLLSPTTTTSQMRDLLASSPSFGLSEFPKLLTGELRLNVPVYTVWGACEDVGILEKIRLAAPSTISTSPPASSSTNTAGISSYSIPNLTVLDEATTRVLLIGGVKLRLFGLGGAVVGHKLFDNGQGVATIAGGGGTMWTTLLQVGEIVDTAMKVYDPTETRLLLSHASPGREPLLAQLALVLKADLTLSAGLHFRYGVSYNEFSVQHDAEAFRGKLESGRKGFGELWETVRGQVESVVDENQKALLANALAVTNRVPNISTGAGAAEESAWKNCWNWNMPDAAFGSLVLDIKDGRIGSEMKSQGFNFAYRQNNARAGGTSSPVPTPTPAPAPSTSTAPPTVNSTPKLPPPSEPTTSTPAGALPPPPQPAPTPFNNNHNNNNNNNNRGGFQNQHQRMASSGPGRGGGGNFTRGPHGPGGGGNRFAGGWGHGSGGSSSSTGGGVSSVKDKEEKKDESTPTATPSSSTPAPTPIPSQKPSTESPLSPPADPSSTPAPTTPTGPSRQPSNKQLRQNSQPQPPRSNSTDQVPGTTTGGESSSGEQNGSAKSPPGSERGRGRGRGGLRGRGGEFRGRGRGGRGGRSEGESGEGSTPTAAAAGEGPQSSGGHKAGANGGGW